MKVKLITDEEANSFTSHLCHSHSSPSPVIVSMLYFLVTHKWPHVLITTVFVTKYQIKSFLLVYGAEKTTINDYNYYCNYLL